MKIKNTLFVIAFTTIFLITKAIGQTSEIQSNSDFLVAQPATDRTVSFNVSDTGVYKPIIWGLDLAWLSESNIRRGIAFMGADRVDVVRASFQPTLPLVNGDLQAAQIADLNARINLINLTGSKTLVALNCDHPTVDAWYAGNAERWAQLIDVTTRRVQERGRKVITVSPFNEPDFGWGQGTVTDFYNIAGELRKNPRFDTIRISGGNTLNSDQALPWYNQLKSRLDEGNTHQLAGSFDNFASFYKTVRANGHHATGDELHNVMEAMVGVEYGMQTGIWWGTAEYARGEFVKASDGRRLAYAEHRPNWTAASVYRNPEGKVQAFGGTSERQAVTTSYSFLSKEKSVFFDGKGPQRTYTMILPGGTAYQTGQTNAEAVVNISWGDDVQPVINGKYVLVNRLSKKVMEVALASTAAGANVRQNAYTAGATHQQWEVRPVDTRIGGDFSYFTFVAAHSGKAIDLLNWSLDNGGNLIVWDDVKGGNQQYYLEYVEDGWFLIRSRHSAKCVEVANNSSVNGANVQQWDVDGGFNQHWRFLPVDAAIEFVAPTTPATLTAAPGTYFNTLEWPASPESDVVGYTIFRTETTGQNYEIIARNVTSTTFVDNDVEAGKEYYYVVKAVDKSLNHSAYSPEAKATATGGNVLLAQYQFEDNSKDNSVQLLHGAVFGTATYTTGKTGQKAIVLNGTNTAIQLPSNVANSSNITVACWVYPRSTNMWQRIFDFGNGDSQYMFLTHRSSTGQIRFAIKNGGAEQILNATSLTLNKWSHIAVTLDETTVKIYVNGQQVAASNSITIRPADFKPLLNYIGRSQYPDPLLNGYIDDFRIYNYALPAEDIMKLTEVISGTEDIRTESNNLKIWPSPATFEFNMKYENSAYSGKSSISIFSPNGRILLQSEIDENSEKSFNISGFSAGIYFIKISNPQESIIRKLVVN